MNATKPIPKLYQIDTVYSPDDGGWYAEVWSVSSKDTDHQTKITSTERHAIADARRWINKQDNANA